MDIELLSRKLGTKRAWLREMLAEFIGTFLIVFLGNSSVAALTFSAQGDVNVTSVNIAYGFAVTMGVLAAGGNSGAHLNPAVTLAVAIVGKFKWRKMFHYFAAQYLGAFIAAACTFLIYYEALNAHDGGVRVVQGGNATAGIWATYPKNHLSLGGAFVDQFLGTFILLLVICAITDPRNNEVVKGLYALYVGVLVITIGIALGYNCGYAINPARDLSPRLFLMIAGWGTEAFTFGDFWWVPIVGPHLGGIAGTLFYVFAIEIHTPPASTRGSGSEDLAQRIQVASKS